MPTKKEVREGGGPWSFSSPELAPGEKWFLDLEQLEHNGAKGWFRAWLPLDGAQVVNRDTGNPVQIEYNRRFPDFVPPNTVDTFTEQGIMSVTVRNEGQGTMDADAVKLSLWKDPYGADDKAREEKTSDWLTRAANDIIPGGLPGGGT